MNFGDPCLPDRFWDKCIPVPECGCWLWLAFTDKKGYGKFWYQGKSRWAHLVTKPCKFTAHHKCYVNCCVNPCHIIDIPRDLNSMFGHENNAYARELADFYLGKSLTETEESAPF